jgi:pilus assembly protein CpaB
MNAQRLIPALVIALLISGLFTFFISKKFGKPHAAATSDKQRYVASTANLEAGETLKAAGLKLVEWPASSPIQGAFAKPEDLAGRIVLYPVAADEPIQERQLSPAGSIAGLTVKIPDGMRAISLRSDQIVGVAGFLLPGNYVDVLVTYHTAASPDPVTTTVLQDVKILATGQKTQPDPEGKATTVDVITLLVKPNDAEKAVLASTQGSVHFVLRNGSDREQTVSQSESLAQLGGQPVAVARAVRPKTTITPTPIQAYSVETVSGGKQTVASFR